MWQSDFLHKLDPNCLTNNCLTFIECPAGWFYHDQSCYFVHGEKLPFDEAKAKCESLSSKLFEPMSEGQNKAIFDIMLAKYGEDTEYYVGISIQDAQDGGRFVLNHSKNDSFSRLSRIHNVMQYVLSNKACPSNNFLGVWRQRSST